MNDEQPVAVPPAELNQAAIDWAWAQPIANNPGARMALLCLARRVDESWECTASQEEVAMDAMVGSRSMRRYLDQLEEGGFVARVKRMDEKGQRLPCAIQLNPRSQPTANLASGRDQRECVAEGRSPSSDPVANLAGGESRTRDSSSSLKKNKKNLSTSEIREDVEQLCSRLLSWLIKKDYRGRPDEVSDAWRREARLLLDKDGAAFDEALAVLDWSQRDHFWHQNINSMPTFREKYGRLELKSRGARGDAPAAATGTTHQLPTPLPARVGGYDNARNFGKRRS